MLSVALLQVTESAYELFAGDVFVVGEEVSLSGLSGIVDKDVGIGGHSSNSADHVTEQMIYISQEILNKGALAWGGGCALVQDVELLSGSVLLQQL